jgi:hypothetical protein
MDRASVIREYVACSVRMCNCGEIAENISFTLDLGCLFPQEEGDEGDEDDGDGDDE